MCSSDLGAGSGGCDHKSHGGGAAVDRTGGKRIKVEENQGVGGGIGVA
mgnify:CR=1 FL=1